jgi:GNAT superfamily N-acetyltransferase
MRSIAATTQPARQSKDGDQQMGVTIRAARSGDGAGISSAWQSAAAYYADLDHEHFQVPSADGLADIWDSQAGPGSSDSLQLVAELDGQVVGWLAARIEHPAPDAAMQLVRDHGWTRLVVDALIVHQGQWRRGTGTALLEAAEDWGRSRGAQVARLDTYAHSPVSVPFYEDRMGYQRRSIVFQKRL